MSHKKKREKVLFCSKYSGGRSTHATWGWTFKRYLQSSSFMVDENTVIQLMSFCSAGLIYRGSRLNYLDSLREKHQWRKIHRILAAPHPEQFSVGFSSCSDSPNILETQGLLHLGSAPELWGCFRACLYPNQQSPQSNDSSQIHCAALSLVPSAWKFILLTPGFEKATENRANLCAFPLCHTLPS